MVDLDPRHKMRGMKDITQEPAFETIRRKKRVRLFRRTSYFLFFVFVAIVIFIVSQIRQPEILRPDLRIVELDVWQTELRLETAPMIVDMREKYKYDLSRIPGAVWGERDSCHGYGVDLCSTEVCTERRNWYFYSDHGENYHEITNGINVTYARQCWGTLFMLEGGIEGWIEAGNAVDSTAVNP